DSATSVHEATLRVALFVALSKNLADVRRAVAPSVVAPSFRAAHPCGRLGISGLCPAGGIAPRPATPIRRYLPRSRKPRSSQRRDAPAQWRAGYRTDQPSARRIRWIAAASLAWHSLCSRSHGAGL